MATNDDGSLAKQPAEVQEIRLSCLYAKELGQKYISRENNGEVYSTPPVTASEVVQQQSYNSWKSKNQHLFKVDNLSETMVSSLGKRLEMRGNIETERDGNSLHPRTTLVEDSLPTQNMVQLPPSENLGPLEQQERTCSGNMLGGYVGHLNQMPEEYQLPFQKEVPREGMAYINTKLSEKPAFSPYMQSPSPKAPQQPMGNGLNQPYPSPGMYDSPYYLTSPKHIQEHIDPNKLMQYTTPPGNQNALNREKLIHGRPFMYGKYPAGYQFYENVHHYTDDRNHNFNKPDMCRNDDFVYDPRVPESYFKNRHSYPRSERAATDQCYCHCCLTRKESPNNRKESGSSHSKSNGNKERNDRVSVKNLYRIVWLQNEQLAILQRQVDKLTEYIQRNKYPAGKGANSPSYNTENPSDKISPPVRNKTNKSEKSLQTKLKKTSVGVMTSFKSNCAEVNDGICPCCGVGKTSKTQFSLEEDSSNEENYDHPSKRNENNLILGGLEIPTIQEQIPTPQPSLHLDPDEFSSESSDENTGDSSPSDEDDSEDHVINSEGGRHQRDYHMDFPGRRSDKNLFGEMGMNVNGEMDEIRNATFEQLRRLGVSILDAENQGQKRVTFDPTHCERFDLGIQHKAFQSDSDTSMHINALAMKYLKGEATPGVGDRVQGMTVYNIANGSGNLSFATLRYLERYQLYPPNTKGDPIQKEMGCERVVEEKPKRKKENKKKKSVETISKSNKENKSFKPPSKILDVTAIKQQPKLLPKNSNS